MSEPIDSNISSQSGAVTNSNDRPLLEVSGLAWSAGAKKILSDIDFSIGEGEFVGLIGPNGAGKSSLMRCLYRVNQPDAGKILFNGSDIWQQSARETARNIAVILQEHSEHMGLCVEEIVSLGLTPHKQLFERETSADRKRIADTLEQVDLKGLAHAQFQHLSGGEKQRVMLARAMLQSPRFLIMDEPTNHLDVHYQIDVLRLVRSMGLTVLASFHDLNLAAAFCDRILLIDQGKLVASGRPEEVLTEDMISRVYQTCALVDQNPIGKHPRVSYAYDA